MFTVPNSTSKLKVGLLVPEIWAFLPTSNRLLQFRCCQILLTARLQTHPTALGSLSCLAHLSLPWMPSGKVHANSPKSALAELNTKPWCTSWSFRSPNVPISIPDSFPQYSSGTESKS